MATGGKEEDLLLGETYLPQDTEAPQDASTVGMRDTMHATAPKGNSHPVTRGTTDKPTSSTYRIRRNRTTVTTTKCMMSKKWTQ